IVVHAGPLAGADGCAIYEYDEHTQEFHLRATHNYDPALVAAITASPLRKGEGVMGRAAERGEPIQIPDITQPGAYETRQRDVLVRAAFRALLSCSRTVSSAASRSTGRRPESTVPTSSS